MKTFSHHVARFVFLGLDKARARLEAVKLKFPDLSYGDLWSLAAVVAIESMGGPKIFWRPGLL